jgi:RNA polymerase sigma-70 factor (ECF subfamily)
MRLSLWMNEESPSTADVIDIPDSRIVDRVVSGDRDAFALLVDRYAPALQRFLGGRGLIGLEVEEAAQDVFVKVYRSLAGLRDGDKFGNYLMTSASRYLIDRMRRRSVSVSAADLGQEVVEASCESNAVSNDELQAAIALLPESMQVVLGLKYGGEKTAAEIARILGQSVNTVTKTLSRAYEQLRRNPQLRRAWEEGE